jgi:broad specificity phosphatase PhoE
MQIVCIRHLPTEWNEKGLLQGTRDIPLLDLTEKTARRIARNKELLPPDAAVIASEYRRTQETARHYGFAEFVVEPLTNELSFGSFEGSPKELLIQRHGDAWLNAPLSLTLGEPLTGFQSRVLNFISKYKHHGQVILFGHGAFIRALMSVADCNHINKMNTMEVTNNQLVSLRFQNDSATSPSHA